MIQWSTDGRIEPNPDQFADADAARAEFERRRTDITAAMTDSGPRGMSGYRFITNSATEFSYAYGKSKTAVVIGQSLIA